MSDPKLLMLDEPSLGLAPKIVEQIFSIITRLCEVQGISILLVEQNAARALQLADRAYVIESGEMIMQGEAKAMLNDPRVRAAYLGE
ncbi:MAG: ABC transporter ATP-binding protein, partial [Betaproteobacteria bacterium]|nr:ABC transporter ATP-binding protein [Betaproteobacteria bacterium]